MLASFKQSILDNDADPHSIIDGELGDSQIEQKEAEDPTHVLGLIEKNEKLNEAVPDEVI